MNPPPQSGDNGCDQENKGRLLDETLAILQHRYRRDIIEYFSHTDEHTAETTDLASYIVNKRDPSPETDEILSQLHHIHLPRLAKAELIEWDPRNGHVRYHPNDRFERWIARIHELEN